MYFNLIKKYINLLKKEDILKFAEKQKVLLNKNELDIIYNAIKTRWEEIYYNGIKVINEYKDKLCNNTYSKLVELYNEYKNKYLK